MANKRQRYYSDDDIEHSITPSQLKRLGRERQRNTCGIGFTGILRTRPKRRLNSREGGYLYIWGGPYNAHDELFSEFGSLIPEQRIIEAAEEMQDENGIYDWAPGNDHPATREREEEWRREQDERDNEPPQGETLEQITERLRSGAARLRYGDGFEREQRNAIRADLDKLNAALAQVTPTHGGIGHNNPPPDDESPQAVVVVDVRIASETIGQELAKVEPNALEVAEATSRLQVALGWLGKKLDAAADSFAKGFGTALGAAAAAGLCHGRRDARSRTTPTHYLDNSARN